MISQFDEINLIMTELEKKLQHPIEIFIIGGAALLHHNVGKGFTKDIDVVLCNQEQFEAFKLALKKMGFETKRKPISHDKLEIFEMLENREFRFDLFVNSVCGGFCLSEKMMKRAEKISNNKLLNVYVCSKEDIFIFKSLSPDRLNDVEDSIELIKKGVNWNTIFDELLLQTKICTNQKKSNLVWYFIKRIHDLEERGAQVPIRKKAIELHNKLQDSTNL